MKNLLSRFIFYILYLRKPPWDTGITPPEVVDFIHNHPPGTALDLGCGTGTNVLTLAQNGWQVTGVDFVGKAIQTARQKAVQAGLEVNLVVDDVTRLDTITGPFDLILDIGCFHSLDDIRKVSYVNNLPGLLSSDGTYLMYAFFKTSENSGTGITEEDLEDISQHLNLVSRHDGTERGQRPSVWMTFRKSIETEVLTPNQEINSK
jgi:cyclopropane fatty-acyl-phospholipid synthase-like methyltransferase